MGGSLLSSRRSPAPGHARVTESEGRRTRTPGHRWRRIRPSDIADRSRDVLSGRVPRDYRPCEDRVSRGGDGADLQRDRDRDVECRLDDRTDEPHSREEDSAHRSRVVAGVLLREAEGGGHDGQPDRHPRKLFDDGIRIASKREIDPAQAEGAEDDAQSHCQHRSGEAIHLAPHYAGDAAQDERQPPMTTSAMFSSCIGASRDVLEVRYDCWAGQSSFFVEKGVSVTTRRGAQSPFR